MNINRKNLVINFNMFLNLKISLNFRKLISDSQGFLISDTETLVHDYHHNYYFFNIPYV